MALYLQLIGSFAAIVSAFFWWINAKVNPKNIDQFGRMRGKHKNHQQLVIESGQNSRRAALASAFAALCFGLQGLAAIYEGSTL